MHSVYGKSAWLRKVNTVHVYSYADCMAWQILVEPRDMGSAGNQHRGSGRREFFWPYQDTLELLPNLQKRTCVEIDAPGTHVAGQGKSRCLSTHDLYGGQDFQREACQLASFRVS